VAQFSVGTNSRAPQLSLKVETVAVNAVPITEAGERFYIPYSSIRNAFKDSDVSIESYDSGTLKSVSATITDKTGPAITGAVSTVLKVAELVASKAALHYLALPVHKGSSKTWAPDV
jgi:hypothetical protein